MSKRTKQKAFLVIVIELICLVLLGVVLTQMQTTLAVNDQQKNTAEKLTQIQTLVADANADAQQSIHLYDTNIQEEAAALAYIYQHEVDTARTNTQMAYYRELLQVTNVLLVRNDGTVIARAAESPADFTSSRFNQLRTVFSTNKASDPFEVVLNEQRYRYYGMPLDNQTMIVIEHVATDLYQLLEDTNTWESRLSHVSVGLNGYAFAISSNYYTFAYHPNEALVGTDALNSGIPVEALEDQNYQWLTINGERFYCGIALVEDAYVVCAVSEAEIIASRNITVGVILFIFFAVSALLIAFTFLHKAEQDQAEAEHKAEVKTFGKIIYHKAIGRKISVLSIIGLTFIFIITFYMQTLFALSRQSMSNNQRVAEVQQTIDRSQDEIEFITAQYNQQYLTKCRIAAYILDRRPDFATRNDLQELSTLLGVENINVFDAAGVQTATNSSYTVFQVSDNPEDQSYAFNQVLRGGDYLIQEAMADDVSGEIRQYIGVSLRDELGNANGFVQICVTPEKLIEALANMQLVPILDSVKVGKGGFVFAVDKEDLTFAYYPKERLIGRQAAEYGLNEKQFTDGYCNYLTLEGSRYYGSSLETDNYYVYVAVPSAAMTGERLPITLSATGLSLLCLVIFFFILSFERIQPVKKETESDNDAQQQENVRNIDVVLPDGSVKKSESAESRWSNISVSWKEKTPDQQLFTLLKGLMAFFAVMICLAVILKDYVFDSNSIFLFVLSGNWDRGVNIFAVTGCLMIMCVGGVATMIVRQTLKMLSNTLGARGETVCRLIRSFVKYFSVIAIMYYCFALFGVDTQTLLASAGILTLIVGLGAKSLVSDILAGLFIIFEGEFRVGDIVTVGDWRGTVVEIGIRTTKIESGGKDVKIINNSNISGVINMTRQYSYAWADVGIEYGESLERVENILEKEFPNIKRRLPAILDGPFYKGVVSLGDNSVNIRIMVVCSESSRLQMVRDLNREMKLIFDKYDINIPFPQVVINQPTDFKKATEWEKYKADKFNESQKELAQNSAISETSNQ